MCSHNVDGREFGCCWHRDDLSLKFGLYSVVAVFPALSVAVVGMCLSEPSQMLYYSSCSLKSSPYRIPT